MSLIAKCRTTKPLALISHLLMFASISAIIGCEHDLSANYKLSLTGCEETDYLLIAWNYLSERERATVIGGLASGRLEPAKWQEKDVVSVVFNTTEDALLGAIIIYIDWQTKKVLGSAPRF